MNTLEQKKQELLQEIAFSVIDGSVITYSTNEFGSMPLSVLPIVEVAGARIERIKALIDELYALGVNDGKYGSPVQG